MRGWVGADAFTHAACVDYYSIIREGVPKDAAQVGEGINLGTVPPALLLRVQDIMRNVPGQISRQYDQRDADILRGVVASLLSDYTEIPGVGSDDIAFAHGSSDAISMIVNFLVANGLTILTPIPNYFAFEESAVHWGGEVLRYSVFGAITEPNFCSDYALVDVLPNGVTGSWIRRPDALHPPSFTLTDHVFSLPLLENRDSFRQHLVRNLKVDDKSALVMSPSKDFAMPGLRAGLVVSRNRSLTEYLHWSRFERGYSVHAAVPYLVTTHLATQLIVMAEEQDLRDVIRRVNIALRQVDLPAFDIEEAISIRAGFATARSRTLANVDLVRSSTAAAASGIDHPSAGFSTFLRLGRDFGSQNEFTEWVNFAGRAGLKLNPHRLFGGDDESWSSLYRDQYSVRINVSGELPALSAGLRRLEQLLDEECPAYLI